jgi:hypothetical protein
MRLAAALLCSMTFISSADAERATTDAAGPAAGGHAAAPVQPAHVTCTSTPGQQTQLYYSSFTDAYIASDKSLTPVAQARFDPMITGCNSADIPWDEVAKYAVSSPHNRAGNRSLHSARRPVSLRHRRRSAGRPAALLRGLRSTGAGMKGG